MTPVSFRLRAWSSWTPEQGVEKTKTVPALLRRRVTPLGQKALSAAWDLPEAANSRLVLSSRYGEFSRTLSLLNDVTQGNDLSPADFTLSVHHALIGLLSIVHSNHRGHVAVAAGQESFCFGLLEAVACLTENPGEPVMLIHYDEPLPEPFSEFNEPGEQPIALALALGAGDEGEAMWLNTELLSPETSRSASHTRDFLHFLKSESADGLSIGERLQWRWARHAQA